MSANQIVRQMSAAERREFMGKAEILINPNWTQIRKALSSAQARTRINRLSDKAVKAAWQEVMRQEQVLVTLGDVTCPSYYRYDLGSTVFQAMRITDDIVGVYIERLLTPPGEATRLPLRYFPDQPRVRFESAMLTFWMQLSDEQLEMLQRLLMLTYFPRSCASINRLFEVSHPRFVSEVAVSLQDLANHLSAQQQDSITWAALKKQYPAIASRFSDVLLSLACKNRITVQALRDYCDAGQLFSLGFQHWSGACRTFPDVQLVMQINSRGLTQPVIAAFGSSAAKKMRRLEQMHPMTLHTIGWLRIHIDETNKLLFIDEVQSDFLESARYWQSVRNPVGLSNQAVTDLLGQAESWSRHGVATCLQWARDIGYQLGIHSRVSAAHNPCMTRSARKWTTYYGSLIKRFGFELTVIPGYPGKIHVLE